MKIGIIIDRPSNSAKYLAEAMGVMRIRPARAAVLRRYDLFINWGCSQLPSIRTPVLNVAQAVSTAISKVDSFAAVLELAPPWSVEPFRYPGITLARRDRLSSGQGIQVIRRDDELPRGCDFYTKYIKKAAEYRLHVVGGRVIFTQQKRRKTGATGEELIRNHANGWVFCENTLSFPSEQVKQELEQCAITAVTRLGLDFGAVDLIVEKGTNRVYFLEANCRPGIESSRLVAAYAEAFGDSARE